MSEDGFAIRFVRYYGGKPVELLTNSLDQAMILAAADDREIPFVEKVADALIYLKTRTTIH